MTWEQGREAMDRLIGRSAIQRVPPSRAHADSLITQATQHLGAAKAIVQIDPTGAYQLMYDAARKALCAVLENQGLRATSRGGHIAVFDAVSAQLDPPHGDVVRPFDRLRRRRNQAEYPNADSPSLTAEEVERDLPKVQAIIDLATGLLDDMEPC